MATTTTNYGFDVPTSSDLVKNGATAISTLGQDLDTFLFRPFTKNVAINGAFDIFQRGTSTTVNNAWTFVADRWMGYRATSCTYSQQATNDTTNLPDIQYCIRMNRTAGDTATGTMYLQQSVETANAIPYAGKQVTFSFYARAGANYSSTSNLLSVFLYTGTGTDQNVKDGYTGSATPINTTVTLTTTWQRFSVTGTVAATAKEFAPYFTRGTAGTAGAADYCEITGVQVEVGNQVSPFTRAGGSIQQELAACQRYYFRNNALANYSTFTPYSPASTTSNWDGFVQLPVTMRTYPSTLEVSNAGLTDGISTTFTTGTWTLNGSYYSTTTPCVRYTHGSAALTSGRVYSIQANANSSAYLGFSAEL